MKSTGFLQATAHTVARLIVFGFFLLAGASEFSRSAADTGRLEVTRLSATATERLGWQPTGLDDVIGFAKSLSTDTLVIVTEGETVATLGNPRKRYRLHSIRKALLSALVGQHVGSDPKQIPLDATLQSLGVDDTPDPLTPLQSQATVHHLLKSTSGINHAAAAEEGLFAEKNRRLGTGENTPGMIWAYNNWDYNALTTVFEARTGQDIADAFKTGIALPLAMFDFTAEDVSHVSAPELSRHRAAMFRMSGRDLARFGELYLNGGMFGGKRVLPEAWINRISTDFTRTGIKGLRNGHGYLWWVPGPETGLPDGTFWAWGFGQQALFVIPQWRTVIVHQSDTTEFWKRLSDLTGQGKMAPGEAFEKLALSCLEQANRTTEFCAEHGFILRRPFAKLLRLIVNARR